MPCKQQGTRPDNGNNEVETRIRHIGLTGEEERRVFDAIRKFKLSSFDDCSSLSYSQRVQLSQALGDRKKKEMIVRLLQVNLFHEGEVIRFSSKNPKPNGALDFDAQRSRDTHGKSDESDLRRSLIEIKLTKEQLRGVERMLRELNVTKTGDISWLSELDRRKLFEAIAPAKRVEASRVWGVTNPKGIKICEEQQKLTDGQRRIESDELSLDPQLTHFQGDNVVLTDQRTAPTEATEDDLSSPILQRIVAAIDLTEKQATRMSGALKAHNICKSDDLRSLSPDAARALLKVVHSSSTKKERLKNFIDLPERDPPGSQVSPEAPLIGSQRSSSNPEVGEPGVNAGDSFGGRQVTVTSYSKCPSTSGEIIDHPSSLPKRVPRAEMPATGNKSHNNSIGERKWLATDLVERNTLHVQVHESPTRSPSEAVGDCLDESDENKFLLDIERRNNAETQAEGLDKDTDSGWGTNTHKRQALSVQAVEFKPKNGQVIAQKLLSEPRFDQLMESIGASLQTRRILVRRGLDGAILSQNRNTRMGILLSLSSGMEIRQICDLWKTSAAKATNESGPFVNHGDDFSGVFSALDEKGIDDAESVLHLNEKLRIELLVDAGHQMSIVCLLRLWHKFDIPGEDCEPLDRGLTNVFAESKPGLKLWKQAKYRQISTLRELMNQPTAIRRTVLLTLPHITQPIADELLAEIGRWLHSAGLAQDESSRTLELLKALGCLCLDHLTNELVEEVCGTLRPVSVKKVRKSWTTLKSEKSPVGFNIATKRSTVQESGDRHSSKSSSLAGDASDPETTAVLADLAKSLTQEAGVWHANLTIDEIARDIHIASDSMKTIDSVLMREDFRDVETEEKLEQRLADIKLQVRDLRGRFRAFSQELGRKGGDMSNEAGGQKDIRQRKKKELRVHWAAE